MTHPFRIIALHIVFLALAIPCTIFGFERCIYGFFIGIFIGILLRLACFVIVQNSGYLHLKFCFKIFGYCNSRMDEQATKRVKIQVE